MIIAVVLHASSPLLALGLAVTLAAAVLVAHWGAFRPPVKKMVAASLLLLALATVAVVPVVRAEDEFVMQDPCKKYTSSDWQWWAAGCFLP